MTDPFLIHVGPPEMKPPTVDDRGVSRHERQTFVDDLKGGPVVRDAHFVECAFNYLLAASMPHVREFERVTFERTRLNDLGRVRLREVTIDRMKDRVQFDADSTFDRVTVLGAVQSWRVRGSLDELTSDALERHLDHYDAIAWALDLRGAQLGELELGSVPADKILRDPRRHFILRKARLREDTSWKTRDEILVRRLTYWLAQPVERTLIVAGELTPSFARDLAWYQNLRRDGFAE